MALSAKEIQRGLSDIVTGPYIPHCRCGVDYGDYDYRPMQHAYDCSSCGFLTAAERVLMRYPNHDVLGDGKRV